MTKFQAVQKVDVGLKDLTVAEVDQGDEVNGHDHNLKGKAFRNSLFNNIQYLTPTLIHAMHQFTLRARL